MHQHHFFFIKSTEQIKTIRKLWKGEGNYFGFGKANDKGKYGGEGYQKGGPRGGCWTCGGDSSDCPMMKPKGGKGINGVDGQGETSKDESVELGGGKGEVSSNEWNYENEIGFGHVWGYSMEYDKSEYMEPIKPSDEQQQVKQRNKICRDIFNVKDESWEKVTFIGDSGAVDHVVSKDTAKAFKVHPTIASKAGINFRAANGGVIKNFGQKQLYGFTNENDEFRTNVQVTDAQRNLASFGKMVKQGNDVILSEKGSFIKNQKTGKVINLNMKNGCPTFDMWIKRADQYGKYGNIMTQPDHTPPG